MGDRLGQHAVVIGGSIAGMLTARVLSDFFDTVTVLERDPIPEQPANRKSVPQGHHYHALLYGGERVMSALFSGFADDLEKCGAVRIRMGTEIGYFLPDGKAYHPWGTVREPSDLGMDVFSLSRPAIESCVRQRLRQIAAVKYLDGVSVKKPVASGSRIGALEYAHNGYVEIMEADFIVDTSGRGCRAPRWLAALGFSPPPATEIGIDFAYSTIRYRIPRELWGDEKIKLLIGPPPDYRDYGFAALIEDDVWMICMAGRAGNHPPGDEEGFFAFARALHDPTLFGMIAAGERVSDVYTYRYPTSIWRHYEALEAFPDGYLLLGDALATFNPIHAQGMSSAANQVAVLQRLLAQRAAANAGLDAFARPFFTEVAKVIETPWILSTGADLAYPDTVGERPPDFETQGQYFMALAALLPDDYELNKQVTEVFHLARPISELFDKPLKARVEGNMRKAS